MSNNLLQISSFNIFQHPLKEEESGEPWTFVAKYKLQVENDLKYIPNLNYTILRPAIVYGCGDRNGLGNNNIFFIEKLKMNKYNFVKYSIYR